MWEDKLSDCQIRGWIAVSAAGLHGRGSCIKNAGLFIDTGISEGSDSGGLLTLRAGIRRSIGSFPGIRSQRCLVF